MKTQKISRPDNSLQKFYSSRRGAGFTTLEFMGGSNYDRPFFFVALSPNSAKDICRTHGASSKAIITSEQSLTKDSIRASYPALVDHAVIERKLREYEEYIDHLESIILDRNAASKIDELPILTEYVRDILHKITHPDTKSVLKVKINGSGSFDLVQEIPLINNNK